MTMFASSEFFANTATPVRKSQKRNAMSFQCNLYLTLKFAVNFENDIETLFHHSVLYNIMTNTFVLEDYKQRLRSAARFGRDYEQCDRYDCPTLNSRPGNRIFN